MIENWSDFFVGVFIGTCITLIVVIFLLLLRMHLKFKAGERIWEHEDKYHADEKKKKES